MTRVAIVAPDDWTLWLFYRHLIIALRDLDAQITAFTAAGPYVPQLLTLGVEHIPVPYARFIDPLADIRLYRALRHHFRKGRFEIVQNITIKANLYGALAASKAGVADIINTVEGAGLLYSDRPSVRVRLIRAIAEAGLRHARGVVSQYWFVNEHDLDVFVARGLTDREKSVVAMATGVDMRMFDPAAIDAADIESLRREIGISPGASLVVNVAGRLLRSKGIAEFIESARILQSASSPATFLLVGPEEPGNPDAFPTPTLNEAVERGIVRWIPFREDIATVYAAAEVAVVPSYYAEGTPKGVLEGMAMARACVCSDIPSIRSLVSDGVDAMLVRPRSAESIACAVASLLASPVLRDEIGRAARIKAVAQFDGERAAVAAVEKVYGRLSAWQGH